jgi:hypothetical protein
MRLFLLFLSLFIAGCAEDSTQSRKESARYSTKPDLGCHEGVKAFSSTVHPLLRRDCLPCHDIGGIANKPHSVAEVEKS